MGGRSTATLRGLVPLGCVAVVLFPLGCVAAAFLGGIGTFRRSFAALVFSRSAALVSSSAAMMSFYFYYYCSNRYRDLVAAVASSRNCADHSRRSVALSESVFAHTVSGRKGPICDLRPQSAIVSPPPSALKHQGPIMLAPMHCRAALLWAPTMVSVCSSWLCLPQPLSTSCCVRPSPTIKCYHTGLRFLPLAT